MRVNETRCDRFPAKIYFLGGSTPEIQHVCVASYGKKPVARNCHGLRPRLLVIHGQNISVIENEVRLFLFQGKQRNRSHCAEKLPARSSIVHCNPLQTHQECSGCYDGAALTSTRQITTTKESKATEELVEFVGGVKVGFEVAGSQPLAKIVEPAREKIERGGEYLLIGEHDVPPGGIRTAC